MINHYRLKAGDYVKVVEPVGTQLSYCGIIKLVNKPNSSFYIDFQWPQPYLWIFRYSDVIPITREVYDDWLLSHQILDI